MIQNKGEEEYKNRNCHLSKGLVCCLPNSSSNVTEWAAARVTQVSPSIAAAARGCHRAPEDGQYWRYRPAAPAQSQTSSRE